jgi:hypothetical protein
MRSWTVGQSVDFHSSTAQAACSVDRRSSWQQTACRTLVKTTQDAYQRCLSINVMTSTSSSAQRAGRPKSGCSAGMFTRSRRSERFTRWALEARQKDARRSPARLVAQDVLAGRRHGHKYQLCNIDVIYLHGSSDRSLRVVAAGSHCLGHGAAHARLCRGALTLRLARRLTRGKGNLQRHLIPCFVHFGRGHELYLQIWSLLSHRIPFIPFIPPITSPLTPVHIK